jgi:hypothetical protein
MTGGSWEESGEDVLHVVYDATFGTFMGGWISPEATQV